MTHPTLPPTIPPAIAPRDGAYPVAPAPHTHGALVRYCQRRGLLGVFTVDGPIRRVFVPDVPGWPVAETFPAPVEDVRAASFRARGYRLVEPPDDRV